MRKRVLRRMYEEEYRSYSGYPGKVNAVKSPNCLELVIRFPPAFPMQYTGVSSLP